MKEIELSGDRVLRRLLDYFWSAIESCSLKDKSLRALASAVDSPAPTPFDEFVFSNISRNYVTCFQRCVTASTSPVYVRYFQLLLLTDMISGMTETFALDLFGKFEQLDDVRG